MRVEQVRRLVVPLLRPWLIVAPTTSSTPGFRGSADASDGPQRGCEGHEKPHAAGGL